MSLMHDFVLSTGLGLPDLLRIIRSAPARYKTYYIPKKHGGHRLIAHPSRELKLLQHIILERYLSRYTVHPTAMAYVRQRNIIDNAQAHINSRVFLKLDFQSFFPSIKVGDWRKFLKSDQLQIFSKEEINITAQLLFWGEGSSTPRSLSIGAPTSPILSNILLFDFDNRVSAFAREGNVNYSRYADDITLSGASIEHVTSVEKLLVREVARMKSPHLTFNAEKRGLYTKSQRRMVTGLIVTPTKDISIGRERKRLISSMLHHYSHSELNVEQIGTLKGLLGFAIANEPAFLERMRKKYSDEVVSAVLKTRIPRRVR